MVIKMENFVIQTFQNELGKCYFLIKLQITNRSNLIFDGNLVHDSLNQKKHLGLLLDKKLSYKGNTQFLF